MKLIAGSRGSRLALVQTKSVIKKIKSIYPDIDVDIKVIKTKGDKILDKALDKIGDKGLFVSEIERQLLSKDIDFAVHSLKDMPSQLMEGLKLTKSPKRADSRDVIILNSKYDKQEDIIGWIRNSKNIKIGTSSKRRSAQLMEINSDLDIVPIRGNIDTRIEKIEKENLDAIVLAAAAMQRLNISGENIYYFDKEEFIPAPAQGALAIEIRKEDSKLEEIFEQISHKKSNFEISAERSFLYSINGSCHVPVGAVTIWREKSIELKAIFGDEDMTNLEIDSISIELDNDYLENNYEKIYNNLDLAEKMGRDLASKLSNKF